MWDIKIVINLDAEGSVEGIIVSGDEPTVVIKTVKQLRKELIEEDTNA